METEIHIEHKLLKLTLVLKMKGEPISSKMSNLYSCKFVATLSKEKIEKEV